MFRKSNLLEMLGLWLVVLLLVAVMGYVLRVGFTQGCAWRRRNNQIHGATAPPVVLVEALQDNEAAQPLEPHHHHHPSEPSAPAHGGQILLLGDSILNNQSYVAAGKSVYDWVRGKTRDSGFQVWLYAKDGATIGEVWQQVNQIPIEYNTESTVLVVSVGGNDFLSGGEVDSAEVAYTHLLERIRSVFSSSKLYLVSLYQPVDPLFAVYKIIVRRWNAFLKGCVEEGLADGMVDLYPLITESQDLTYRIEPSEVGGAKIAEAIVDAVV